MSQSPVKSASKSTLVARSTANPRRTTLASLEDFSQLPGARASLEPIEYKAELPTSTANPRRTVLMTVPVQQQG
ncbi:hypothetical protein [Kitasatospora sp. GAS204B]|uniref:hypothetical protein n=1 Tax=unclassified Kitasatospora TaxID=2633591 RepID=UPI002474C993|nr:hypothetical protein [Kitasatospora sp. GAS204B]MDH6122994.1 hypothetical protein [Kitasatospora sp. GAS204B]